MSYVLRAQQILTSAGAPPIPDGYVVVQGDRITDVGSGRPADTPSGAISVDAGDRTILPGLIDCHTHVAGLHRSQGPQSCSASRITADALDVAAGLGRVLRSGITTIRDCGYPHHGIFAVREAARRGQIPAPRIYLSGRAICATGGHGASLSVEVDGPSAVQRAVRIELKAGAEWIKLMTTGGTATPGEEVTDVQLSAGEIKAAVEEAHRRNRQVCSHCSNLQGAQLLIEAGVDSIEHGIELDGDAVTAMARRGIWLIPTLRCTEIEGTAGPDSGIPEFVRLKAAAIYRRQMTSFRLALDAGVPIAAGTDAQQPYLELGLPALVSELQLMTELGMTPTQAIGSATGHAAALLRDTDIGTVEAGRRADLLVADGDPTRDITRLRKPWLVMAGGKLVSSTEAELAPGS